MCLFRVMGRSSLSSESQKLHCKQTPWSRGLDSMPSPAPLICFLQKYWFLLPLSERKFVFTVLEFSMSRLSPFSLPHSLSVVKSHWKQQCFLHTQHLVVRSSLSTKLDFNRLCYSGLTLGRILCKRVNLGDYYQTKEALPMLRWTALRNDLLILGVGYLACL